MLKSVDYIFIIVLVGVTLLVSFLLRSKNRNELDYFLAGRDVPWWAASIALYATLFTPMSFLGVSGWIFEKDSRWFVGSAIIGALVMPIAARLWVPFWSKRSYISVYQYVGERFGNKVKTFAVVLFLVGTIFWLGNSLVAAAGAFALVSPFNSLTWLLIMISVGVVSTLVGGARAVIWTDVVQFFVFVAAFVAVLLFIMLHFSFDSTRIYELASAEPSLVSGHRHTTLFSSEMSFVVESTIWAIAFARSAEILTFGTQQVAMQRLLSVRDGREMAKASLGFAAIDLAFTALTVSTSWALLAYFKDRAIIVSHGDDAMIKYVVIGMPDLLRGLIVAGVIAALLSTLDSGLNSFAAVVLMDVVKPLGLAMESTQAEVRASKVIVLAGGIILLAFAIWQLRHTHDTVLQRIGQMNSVLSGPMATVFGLGALYTGATRMGAALGGIVALIVSVVLSGFPGLIGPTVVGVNWMWVAGISTCLGFGVGWAVSVIASLGQSRSVRGH